MEKRVKKKMLCGEITAFLSMIFLLILALIGTTLESTRIYVGQSFADRSLQNAMESLYTEYCIPLWKEYHLFFLEGESSQREDEDYIRNTLYDYMDYTYNEEDMLASSMDLLDMEIGQIDVKDIVRANGQEGEILFHEILEYEKYQVDEVILSEQKSAIDAMKEISASKIVIEKQMEAEEKMAEVNMETLKFISAVEGLAVGKSGFRWKRNGLLQTENYFVKQFCSEQVNRSTVGIHHDTVWRSLKNSYVNPVLLIEEMEMLAEQLTGEEEQNERSAGGVIRLKKLQRDLLKTARGMLRQAEKAEQLLNGMRTKQAIFTKEAKALEEVYESQKKDLSLEGQRAFEEEISRLHSFSGNDTGEYASLIKRILNMEVVLENNIDILKDILALEQIPVSNQAEEIEEYKAGLAWLKSRVKNYQIGEMAFDYSSLKGKGDAIDPATVLPDNYESELLEMVVKDTSSVSRKARKQQKKAMFDEGIEMGIEEPLKQVLLSHYIEEHFNGYTGKVSDKDTSLDYEIEFILGEKKSDKDNLEEVIKKIVNIRTLCNYLYLRTDREKTELAYGAAIALVGYSCMEPLIQLTKNLILMTWATEEAIVDVAALLQEKEIPFFKTKETFQIGFEELLLFDKKLVHQKVDRIEAGLSAGIDYKGYLRVLLSLTKKEQKLSGIWELIESNIELRYDPDFSLENCIYGIEVLTKFYMKEKFLCLPGVQEVIHTSGEGFLIQSHFSYCYD